MKKKIFISSSAISSKNVEDNITFLAKNGITNIELSGGCSYSSNILNKLIILKKYKLEYLVHNFSPKDNFVLNIGSCDDRHYKKTIKFYKKSIDLCKKLNVKKYGIHAGFLIDSKTSELNNKIKRELYSKKSDKKIS